MTELKDLIQFGTMVERRDGNFEILVPFSDTTHATQNSSGAIATIERELDLDGLSPDFRYNDIVGLWGLTVSDNGFLDFDNTDRELLWQGNDMPLLSEIEYNILTHLYGHLKDYYFRKNGDTISLVSANFVHYLYTGDASESFDVDYTDPGMAINEEVVLPFEDLYLTMMRDGTSSFNVQDLIDYNAEFFAD